MKRFVLLAALAALVTAKAPPQLQFNKDGKSVTIEFDGQDLIVPGYCKSATCDEMSAFKKDQTEAVKMIWNNLDVLNDRILALEAVPAPTPKPTPAPTAPDTLPCYPVADRDVFAIEEWPDVYFAGMAREFGTRTASFEHADGSTSRTRLVTVPDFQSTGTVAVVDLRTMECSAMTFGADGL